MQNLLVSEVVSKGWEGIKNNKIAIGVGCVALAIIVLCIVNYYTHFMAPKAFSVPVTAAGGACGGGLFLGALAGSSQKIRNAISSIKKTAENTHLNIEDKKESEEGLSEKSDNSKGGDKVEPPSDRPSMKSKEKPLQAAQSKQEDIAILREQLETGDEGIQQEALKKLEERAREEEKAAWVLAKWHLEKHKNPEPLEALLKKFKLIFESTGFAGYKKDRETDVITASHLLIPYYMTPESENLERAYQLLLFFNWDGEEDWICPLLCDLGQKFIAKAERDPQGSEECYRFAIRAYYRAQFMSPENYLPSVAGLEKIVQEKRCSDQVLFTCLVTLARISIFNEEYEAAINYYDQAEQYGDVGRYLKKLENHIEFRTDSYGRFLRLSREYREQFKKIQYEFAKRAIRRNDWAGAATFYARGAQCGDERALQELERLYEQHPDHAHIGYQLGCIFFNKKSMEKATEILQKAALLDPQVQKRVAELLALPTA